MAFVDGDTIYVDAREQNGATCAVHVERNALSERISIGDQVWWQSGRVFWTDSEEVFVDCPFKKIGYSGTQSPLSGPDGMEDEQ